MQGRLSVLKNMTEACDQIVNSVLEGLDRGRPSFYSDLFLGLEQAGVDLNLDEVRALARRLKVSPIFLYEKYDLYQRESSKDSQFLVCDNLTCLSKGAFAIRKFLLANKKLWKEKGLELQFIKCLGACSTGPSTMLQGKMLEQMDEQGLRDRLEKIGES